MNAELSSDRRWVAVLHAKRVTIKQVTKLFPVAKQKQTKPKCEKKGKDGRRIGVRRQASSGKGKK